MRFAVLTWLAGSALAAAAAVLAIGLFYLAPGGWLLETLTSHSGAVPVGNFPRVCSTFVTPSMFCNFLTVTVVIALAAKRVGWIGRVPASVLIATLTISAVFTFSIAFGGLLLAIGIWLWFDCDEGKLLRRAAPVGLGVIALTSLAIAPFALPANLWSSTDIFSMASPSESSRYMVWRESLHTFLSRPFTGSGIGTAAANVQFENYDGSRSLLTDAHNIFLSVAAQAGVVGLFSLLVLIGAILKTALSHRTDSNMGKLRSAFVIAFLTAFVFEGLTGSFEDARHLWVLIGLIIAARKIESAADDRLSTSLNGT
jgi:O-antigen ligase